MKYNMNPIQRDFILKALDLANHIVDFDLTDVEFEEFYGMDKLSYNKEIEKLRGILI